MLDPARILCGLSAAAILCAATPVGAVTITYTHGNATDGNIAVGFANDASGWTTADYIQSGNAYSRADTAYGPLPPVGQLPSFDAQCDARSEFGTNLNAAAGAGVRSAFAPLTTTFDNEASGQLLQPGGSYTSYSYLHSAQAGLSGAVPWIIQVNPSLPGENIGDLATVTIDASIVGQLDATGGGYADATYLVTTTSNGSVMSGSLVQATAGSTPFSDTGSLQFAITLGSSFELFVSQDLNATGSGAAATSRAAVSASLVEVSVALGPPMAPPNIVAQLTADFPDAQNITWTQNNAGTRWIAVGDIAGVWNKFVYDNNAVLRRHLAELDAASLPADIAAVLAADWSDWSVRRAVRIERFTGSAVTPQYRLRLRNGPDKARAFFAEDGTLLQLNDL